MTEPTAPEDEAAPTCYRHPDRETYVRCTRCDRPICPDCMNTAAVGFQCPECVREGNKSVRQARTVFGGRVGADANVTKVLIGLNVIAFVAQLASKKFTDDFMMQSLRVVFDGQYYRMLTSAFLHDDRFFLHIAFNMYALLLVGSQIERLLGATRYVVLYLVAALGGSVATLLFMAPVSLNREGELVIAASLGASGAIFGLFGAFFVLLRRLKADTSQVLLLIGINLAIGFAAGGYINNYAHLGGLVAGGAVAYAMANAPAGSRRSLFQYGGAVLVTVALLVATAWRAADWKADGYETVVINSVSDEAASAAVVPSL
ncbi:MAG TPA: rhomboid family intramembrane serine protease [Frankiaceae bacterium]|jgi:membrane associated rhomboid family serine protease|nr:rhomboid family intramembrane serine protease [Frankiaceae bacterium]